MGNVYYRCMYGGRISLIVLNIPSDEPAMMTTLDGYPIALKGRGGEALGLCRGLACGRYGGRNRPSLVRAAAAWWGLFAISELPDPPRGYSASR
ncbi:tripartite tricarboxylate transporter permease [Litchfieldella xinjiangensis]|uniref:tripartite tricarboxylate transporter permease n=1 Tax=Litchfieldella xinjiangensis TaxID=1166948 RepID=UPI003BF55A0F